VQLPASPAEQPEDQGENDAQEDRSGQGNVEGRVLAPVDKVARQTANWEIEAGSEDQRQPDNYDDATQNEQQLSQPRHYPIVVVARNTLAADVAKCKLRILKLLAFATPRSFEA
jgi:hypothetical protein